MKIPIYNMRWGNQRDGSCVGASVWKYERVRTLFILSLVRMRTSHKNKVCFQNSSTFHEIWNGLWNLLYLVAFIDAKEPGENNRQLLFSAPLNFLPGC